MRSASSAPRYRLALYARSDRARIAAVPPMISSAHKPAMCSARCSGIEELPDSWVREYSAVDPPVSCGKAQHARKLRNDRLTHGYAHRLRNSPRIRFVKTVRRGSLYFLVSKEAQAVAAKIKPAALSASLRIASNGMPNWSCAMLPVIIAAMPAVASAMTRKATLPMRGTILQSRGHSKQQIERFPRQARRSRRPVEIAFFDDAIVRLIGVSDAVLKIAAFGRHQLRNLVGPRSPFTAEISDSLTDPISMFAHDIPLP
jgi:hypothetical protein